MRDFDEILNSKALEIKIDERARKVFFKSVANIKLLANPLAFLVLLLVGFIFTELNTNVKLQNSLLVVLSAEFKEVRNQTVLNKEQTILNKEAIVRLIDQQLISNYNE